VNDLSDFDQNDEWVAKEQEWRATNA
jgi:hypothetical protein